MELVSTSPGPLGQSLGDTTMKQDVRIRKEATQTEIWPAKVNRLRRTATALALAAFVHSLGCQVTEPSEEGDDGGTGGLGGSSGAGASGSAGTSATEGSIIREFGRARN